MFNTAGNEKPTSQQICEFLLQEIEASKQVIGELNDEELEEITGGRQSSLASGTALMHLSMAQDIYPEALANGIQKMIRDNAKAGKSFEVNKKWTKSLTNPQSKPKSSPGIYKP